MKKKKNTRKGSIKGRIRVKRYRIRSFQKETIVLDKTLEEQKLDLDTSIFMIPKPDSTKCPDPVLSTLLH